MRKNGKTWLVKAILCALALMMGTCGHAVTINMDEGPVTVEAVEIEDAKALIDADELPAGEAESLNLKSFQLIGTADDGLLIFADGRFFTVAEDALPEVTAQLGEARMESLPDITDMDAIGRNAKGDEVKELQQALVDLGYLSGSADGQFGGKSQSAVSAFQQAMGLEETGTADALTQLLILSAKEAPVSIVSDFDPAMRYPELVGHTSANLSAVAEYGLVLEYDDIEGIGKLGNDATAEVDATDGADIDSRLFDLEFKLSISQDRGVAVIEPVVELRCECVRRPVMQSLVLKSGDERCTVEITDLRTELSGPKSIEIGTAKLDADALRVLANAADADELKFRIKCKYSEYDGEVEDTEAVAIIGQAGLAL